MAAVTGETKGGMWLRPLHVIGEEEGNHRPGRWRGMQACNAVRRALLDGVGVARMVDGTELHLRHMLPEDDKLTLAGKDHPAPAEVLLRHKGVFDDPPLGLPPDRGIKLCLKTMPPSRPVKRLSAGELTELDRQLHDLYERGWIERSTAGHAAAVVFVRKPDPAIMLRLPGAQRHHGAACGAPTAHRHPARTDAGVLLFLEDRSGVGLSPDQITGVRSVEDQLPVAAGAVSVEGGAVWPAGLSCA